MSDLDLHLLPHMIECGHVYIGGCSERGEVIRLNRSATDLFSRWLSSGIPLERDENEEKLFRMLSALHEQRTSMLARA